MQLLTLSVGNTKLAKDTLILSIPAGKTCPGASLCKSMAVIDLATLKRKIKDGPLTEFRCFAASAEVQYDNVYLARKRNLDLIMQAIKDGTLVNLIEESIKKKRTKKTMKIRIHEGGDFFSLAYLLAWIEVAKRNPCLDFYCYSKSLNFFLGLELPSNFYMTASKGGKFDSLIEEGHFPRFAEVFMYEEDATTAGLQVDHDDSHCFIPGPFALIVHAGQPKGSDWGKAVRENRKAGKFSGYNKETKKVFATV